MDNITPSKNKVSENDRFRTTEEVETDDQPQIKPDLSYPIAVVEFDRVQTPFIIGVWILSASVAKIGNFYSFLLIN